MEGHPSPQQQQQQQRVVNQLLSGTGLDLNPEEALVEKTLLAIQDKVGSDLVAAQS